MIATNPYVIYEAEKRNWLIQHPVHTPEQYQAACRAIAERLGV